MNSATVEIGDDGLHDERVVVDAGDRRDVAHHVEWLLLVECDVDRMRRRDQQQRVPVGGRPRHRLERQIAAAARPVLDQDRLADTL